jgi:anti-sigma B factor antagonist
MDLSLDVRTERGSAVLEVSGEVDIYTAPKLREKLVELVESGNERIVVDLEGVGFMDSTGLGSLVAGLKRVKERDGEMVLVCTRDPVLKVLGITGLDRVFSVHGSVSEALG